MFASADIVKLYKVLKYEIQLVNCHEGNARKNMKYSWLIVTKEMRIKIAKLA